MDRDAVVEAVLNARAVDDWWQDLPSGGRLYSRASIVRRSAREVLALLKAWERDGDGAEAEAGEARQLMADLERLAGAEDSMSEEEVDTQASRVVKVGWEVKSYKLFCASALSPSPLHPLF